MEQSEHLSETIEDYLQLIYTMRREGAPVIAARVKERKRVSAPTAWATLKRMERDGLVTLDPEHHIELSPQGQERAESIIRRHMLAERLLTDILKLNWADVHDEAHRVEHAISPLIERQILAILDNPETCPHGNPIPGLASNEPSKAYALREAREGAALVVNNIAEHAEDDAALMHYLERNHLIPNTRLHIDEVALSNATITVSLPEYSDQKVAVGLATAELVLVRDE
ncbi:MAG TPA: metal-dependent transcriptional regulator [Dehalococcoidia bacterium]|jgi:DtxR family Mn-dependent transcriptional regulator|nr:metal-dependent transcriptional regulator [Dehalococcoidia bacterium]